MSVMRQLAEPFPKHLIHTNPSGGGSYVKHHVVEQRLIMVLGIPPHFTLAEIVRGDVPAIPPNPSGNSRRAKEGRPALTDVVVGVIARMGVTIDGERVVVEEAGDCEQPHNWDTDGQRLKDAMSDAYKRCAMRLGCGLHLWSQDEFYLYDALAERSQARESAKAEPQTEEVSPTSAASSVSPTSSEPYVSALMDAVEAKHKHGKDDLSPQYVAHAVATAAREQDYSPPPVPETQFPADYWKWIQAAPPSALAATCALFGLEPSPSQGALT